MNKPDRNWDAAQKLTAHNNDSRKLMEIVGYRLEQNENAARDGRVNWGHVGDAENYRAKLLELVVGFTIGPDEDEEDCRERVLRCL